ncbi:DUF1302 family protein [Deltaproteobacteria bacterium TL4]
MKLQLYALILFLLLGFMPSSVWAQTENNLSDEEEIGLTEEELIEYGLKADQSSGKSQQKKASQLPEKGDLEHIPEYGAGSYEEVAPKAPGKKFKYEIQKDKRKYYDEDEYDIGDRLPDGSIYGEETPQEQSNPLDFGSESEFEEEECGDDEECDQAQEECEEEDEDCQSEEKSEKPEKPEKLEKPEKKEELSIKRITVKAEEEEEDKLPITVKGYFSSQLGYRLEKQLPITSESTTFVPPEKEGFGTDPSLVKFRQTLSLNIEHTYKSGDKSMIGLRGFTDNAYGMAGRENFDDEVLRDYEQEMEVTAFWKEGSFFDFADMKFGRQVIVWGAADAGSVTDIINPRDLREPLLTDVDEQRLSLGMVKFDFYPTLKSDLTVVIIGELRFHKLAPPGADFSIIPPQLVYDALIDFKGEEYPKQSIENWELASRYKFDIENGSIAFVAAQVWDDTPHVEYEGIRLKRSGPVGEFVLRHERVEVFGVAATYVLGSFVLKFESAYTRGRRQLLSTEKILEQIAASIQQELIILQYPQKAESRIIPEVSVKKGDVGFNFGFDYTGISHLTLLFEMTGKYIYKYEEDLATKELTGSLVFNASYSMLRETLQLSYSNFYSEDNGSFHRVAAIYHAFDYLQLEGGIAVYEFDKSESILQNITDQDRIFLGVKLSY